MENPLKYFAELTDPRVERNREHVLEEILLIAVAAVLSGAESWNDMEEYGNAKLDWLQSFLRLPSGIPSHDTFNRVFAALDPDELERGFVAWVGSIARLTAGEVIAIDGKALCGTRAAGQKTVVHMVSAWANSNNLVLGQRKVDDKSNEITAIPELLDLLTVKGAVVTIDAMGCQKEIARKIVEKEAGYVLALKGNQGTLSDDVELFFAEQKSRRFKDAKVSRHETLEKSHGRIETRRFTSISDIDWLKKRHDWVGLNSIVMVESTREFVSGKIEQETRFYISSLAADAVRQGDAIRGHWGVESHHWVMDMVFRDDECRIRRDNAPANFATMKHIASNLMRTKADKHSMRAKRRLASWDDDYLASLISGMG